MAFPEFRVSLGVRTCELFLCFVTIVRVRAIVLTSLFSLFYVTGEFHRFLHRGRAIISGYFCPCSSRCVPNAELWVAEVKLSLLVKFCINKNNFRLAAEAY